MEVFILQILDVAVPVKVAVYALETTGEYQDVEKRVNKILLYLNSCRNYLKHSVLTEQGQVCITLCSSCFKYRVVCEQQVNVYQILVPNNLPCLRCTELNLAG